MLLDTGHSSHLLSPDSSSALSFIYYVDIAYSLLALAALQAILLSIQNKFLHTHQPGGYPMMPPLRNMETLLFEVIIVGFIALTISLGSGLIFLENMFAQQLAHKTLLSIFAWFVFLILLIGHWKLGWRGRTAIRWTLSGFVSLMLAYFGSKFVLEIVLSAKQHSHLIVISTCHRPDRTRVQDLSTARDAVIRQIELDSIPLAHN